MRRHPIYFELPHSHLSYHDQPQSLSYLELATAGPLVLPLKQCLYLWLQKWNRREASMCCSDLQATGNHTPPQGRGEMYPLMVLKALIYNYRDETREKIVGDQLPNQLLPHIHQPFPGFTVL